MTENLEQREANVAVGVGTFWRAEYEAGSRRAGIVEKSYTIAPQPTAATPASRTHESQS